jgi:hypothetical protein
MHACPGVSVHDPQVLLLLLTENDSLRSRLDAEARERARETAELRDRMDKECGDLRDNLAKEVQDRKVGLSIVFSLFGLAQLCTARNSDSKVLSLLLCCHFATLLV